MGMVKKQFLKHRNVKENGLYCAVCDKRGLQSDTINVLEGSLVAGKQSWWSQITRSRNLRLLSPKKIISD
jgi:hypothetical protein